MESLRTRGGKDSRCCYIWLLKIIVTLTKFIFKTVNTNLYVHTYVLMLNSQNSIHFVPLHRPSLLFFEWATALAQAPKIVEPPNQQLDG
jgi:hypothetical protein